MATAAFKSNSRRGGGNAIPPPAENSNSTNKKVPPNSSNRRGRSLSVSAVSRTRRQDVDIIPPNEFLNKRDNPLFWGTGSPPADKEIEPAENGGLTSEPAKSDGQRGRSFTRNSDVASSSSKKEIGCRRSLSRVDTGRRGRSVSRAHISYGASESEVEQESLKSSNYGRTNSNSSNLTPSSSYVRKPNSARNAADSMWDRTRSLGSQSNCNPAIKQPSHDSSTASSPHFQIPNWEDGISTGSLSEAEEKTIKAVCEQMKSFQGDHSGVDTPTSAIYETVRSEVRRAISDIQSDLGSAFRRNNATAIGAADVADIPPDLVNPGAVELVLDIRREYARKFEESQERARKLRADLAVEEHRGQELSRILKEILPDPKISTVQRSRPGKRTSSERKRVSKRLTEEAMSYFDECVSISTFDSSDFSAPEDPPLNSVGASITGGGASSLPQDSPCISASYDPNSCLNHKQESDGRGRLIHSLEDSGVTANSTSNETMIDQASQSGMNTKRGRKFQFSIGHKPSESVGLQQDIKSYIKHFEKDVEGGITSEIVRSNYYDIDGYDSHGCTESLFDRVFFNSRIESGSMHLCGGGIAISFLPSASVV